MRAFVPWWAIAIMLIRIHKSHLQFEFENKVSLHFTN